ncbi:MAG: tRNA pseudouridine(38-40) synthase TruA [Planctomycetota bacterium]
MLTCLLTIAYDGTRYAGWQRQLGEDTVQQRLEEALAVIFGGRVVVEGAGRTDAGVHALAQTAHVVLPRPFEPRRLLPALNGNLPPDVAIRAVRPVPAGFHARFCATGKRYLYRCITSRLRPALGRGHFHWVRRPLDLDAMRRAAGALVGRHDFAAFASNPGYVRKRGTVRTLQHVHLVQRRWGFDLVVQGDGFLYNMVRAIAGTLILVGAGRMPPERVGEILAAGDRSQAGPTAPACGLYLARVLYRSGFGPATVCADHQNAIV